MNRDVPISDSLPAATADIRVADISVASSADTPSSATPLPDDPAVLQQMIVSVP